MTDAVTELAELLGPPRAGVVPVPWNEAPAEIGFQFPADYRWLIDTYGQIGINGELCIFGPSLPPSMPGGPGRFAGFLANTTEPSNPCGSLHAAHLEGNHDDAPYPVLPMPGGLLKWGNTHNNDFLFWLTEGSDPDVWPVVVMLYGVKFKWKRFEGTVTEFLSAVCTQRYPDWDELIIEPLGNTYGTPYKFIGDWTGWNRAEY